MYLLGIDLGATYVKGAVLDLEELRPRHCERLRIPGFLEGLPGTFREIDPEAVVAATGKLIRVLLEKESGCAGVVLCNQMHGVVLARPDGTAASNFISWQDQRGSLPHPSGRGTYLDVLLERLSNEERHGVGNETRQGLPVVSLFWLAEEKRLPAEPVVPLSLGDFVAARLCQSRAQSTGATNAAAYGTFHVQAGRWHQGVIEKLGLAGLCWPEIRGQGEELGILAGTGRSVPCHVPVGDHQCALLGALLSDDELSLNIATGSQVSRISRTAEPGPYQVRPYFDGRYLRTVTHIPAGRALNALLRLLTEIPGAGPERDPWDYVARAAAAAPDTDLEVDLTFFSGSGSIRQIREENLSVGTLFRAAFRHMADKYHALALRLGEKRDWRRLVFSGGLAQRLPVLREAIIQKFQSHYRLAPAAEDTLTGLLCLALVSTGRARSTAEATERIRQSYGEAL